MRPALCALFVLLAACPALGRELMTKDKTSIYEKPDKASPVLGELAPNVRVASDKRKDFWFHVSVEIDGKKVSGWVNQADVTTLMGRSKGQLLAENKRLYKEVTKLRTKNQELAQQVRETAKKLKKAEDNEAALMNALKQATSDLVQARKKIEELETAVKKAKGGGK